MTSFLLVLTTLLTTTTIFGEVPGPAKGDVVENLELSAFLVAPGGVRTDKFIIRHAENALVDLEFKAVIPAKYEFTSWAFEFSDPARNLSYRMPGSGPLPTTAHWNGKFSNGETFRDRDRCFVRVLLLLADQRLIGSPWTAFTIQERKNVEQVAVAGHTVGMVVVPSGGLEAASLKTQSFSALVFPNIHGDIRFIFGEKHTLGLRYEQTANGLLDTSSQADAIYHSDFSVSYRRRWLGSEPGEDFGLEVGGKIFSKMLRGKGNLPVDGELARAAQGLAATFYGKGSLDSIRLHFMGELGYTVIAGNMLLAGASVAATYEKFRFVSPGLQLRYEMLTGTPSDDEFDAANNSTNSVTNHLLFAGLLLNFKI